MSPARRARLAAGAVLVACLPVALAPVTAMSAAAGPASSVAAEGPDCAAVGMDDEIQPVKGENDANVSLQVPEATVLAGKIGRTGTPPGAGVKVVVVDSGITGYAGQGPSPLISAHGLVVASIIAGPDQSDPAVRMGIARAASLIDRPFYTAPRGEAGEDDVEPTSAGLEQALRGITAERRTALRGNVIVVVPSEVLHTDTLEQAVDGLVDSGALVIAAAGDRPAEGSFLNAYAGAAKPGEDAAADVWPAGAEGVVSVGASAPGAQDIVLRNSGIDLAAPGTGSVARALNGGACVVTSVSSHWATAQVAGLAALVWSVHAKDSAAELRSRLQGTASGNGEAVSPVIGYGVVQPVEALQREVDAMGADRPDPDPIPRATAPRERADLLADAKENAVWWGLGGGGALVVLLILRPVLSRRRR